MSATIDERVVSMKFNNKDFEQNAKTSLNTIERLKQALNFSASTSGLDNISNAVKRVDMSGLGNAVDSVKVKFSALQIAAVSALNNIVNKAMAAGSQLLKSITIDPIIQGFNEYELKLGSIQTILANTQKQTGTVSQDAIREVNAAAEEAATRSEELNQQAISNLQKRQQAEVKTIEKSNKAQTKALQKQQKAQSKALSNKQSKEVEKLQASEEKKQETLRKSQEKELKSFNEYYEKRFETLSNKEEKELTKLKQNHQTKLDMYKEEYMEQLKVVDENRYNQIKAIDDQIAALKGLTKADKKQKEEAEKLAKMESLKSLRNKAETDEERKYVEEQIAAYQAELDQERIEEERENRIEELEARKDDINEEYETKKETLQKEYSDKVDNENDLYSVEMQKLNETQQARREKIQESYEKEVELLNDKQQKELKALEDKQKKEQKNLQEKQQNETEALQERQQNESDALQERQDAAREALTERQSSEMEALSTRHQAELANIESEKKARINALNAAAAKDVKPTTLEDVNEALDELNTYADKTIYNFADMTHNIGTFTAAGVDLDTSVDAIKGIANLAAMVGANSSKASNAMYQLSQAIASGTVRAEDWRSVETSDMAGVEFQEALKETARVHGIAVDDMIRKNGSFRLSLQEGWLSSEILLETLQKFTGDMTDEELRALGYSEDQIKSIQETAKTAVDAATKVRTWTQVLDTTREAVGSGWAETFEIIFGDFDEATELWTGVSDVISEIVGRQADARNELLRGWKEMGGRDAMIKAFENIWKGIESFIKPIQEAFRDIFPPTTSKQLFDMTKRFETLTEKFKLSEGASKNVKAAFSGLFSIFKIIGGAAKFLFDILSSGTGIIGELAGLTLDAAGTFGKWLTNITKASEESEVFSTGLDGIKDAVAGAFEKVKGFIALIRNWLKTKLPKPDTSFVTVFEGVIQRGSTAIKTFITMVKNNFSGVRTILSKIGKAFSTVGSQIASEFNTNGFGGIIDFLDRFIREGLTVGIGGVLIKFVKDLGGTISKAKGVFKELGEAIGDTFGAISNQINAKALKQIAEAILVLVGALVVLSMVPEEKLVPAGVALSALLAGLVGVMKSISSSLEDAKDIKKVSSTLLSLGASVLLLAMAIKQIAGFDPANMAAATAAIVVLIEEMTRVMNKFEQDGSDPKQFKKSATTLLSLAGSILILSKAISGLATLSVGELLKGGVTVVALIEMLARVEKASKKSNFGVSAGIGMIALATSMLIFQKAILEFSKIDIPSLIQGGGSIAALMLLMAQIEKASKKSNFGASAGVGFIAMAASLLVFKKAIDAFSEISLPSLLKGGAAIAVLMLLMAQIEKASKNGTFGASAGVGFLAIAAALLVLTPVLKTLSLMGIGGLALSLTGLAAAFGVIGLSAKLLKPYTTTFLKLSAGISLLGIAVAGIGAGLLMFSAGLAALAVSGAPAASTLVTVVKTIITGVLDTIGDSVEKIVEVIMKLFLAVLSAIKTNLPTIIDDLYQIISQGFTLLIQYVPQLVALAMEFLLTVIGELGEHIPELVTEVTNLFVQFFAAIGETLRNMDTTTLQDALLGAEILGGLMVAMAGLSAIAGPAIAGIAEAAIMIGELTALITAAGAIAQIPGLTWIVGEGGDLLQAVGTAIGQFAGGIIGGVLEGATSTLPDVGTNLSDFMDNIQGFLTGLDSINDTKLSAVTSLAGIVNTMADCETFITSGQLGVTLNAFADELITFGPKVQQFSDSVSGIDSAAIEAAASAASIMNEVATNLPKTGGFWQDLIGTPKTLETFGAELEAFGPSIKAFSDSVSGGIDTDAVTTAANAAKIMNEVATNLPKTGGFWQDLFGENMSLSDFGADLESFGPSIKAFSDSISGGIDSTAVDSATNAGLALAGLANSLPSSGGFLQDFFGEQNLETFGTQIEAFGSSMKAYSDAITDGNGFDSDAVDASTNAGLALAGLADALPDEAGAFSFFTGESDLEKFGEQLEKFGSYFKDYYDSVSGINTSKLASVVTAITNMVNIAKDTKDLDTKGLKNFGKNLKTMANNGIDGLIDAFEDCQQKVTDAINTMIGYVTTALENNQSTLKEEAKTTGKKVGSGFKSGIESKLDEISKSAKTLAGSVNKAIKEKWTEEKMSGYGSKAIGYVISGLESGLENLETVGHNIGTTVKSSIGDSLFKKGYGDTVGKIGYTIYTELKDGMYGNDNINYRNLGTLGHNFGITIKNNLVAAAGYWSMYNVGLDIGDGLAAGMNKKKQTVATAASNLGKSAIQATQVTVDSHSPSVVFDEIGQNIGIGLSNGMDKKISLISATASSLGQAAIDPIAEAMGELQDDMIDYDPTIVGKNLGSGLSDGMLDKLPDVEQSGEMIGSAVVDPIQDAINRIQNATDSMSEFTPTITPVVDLSKVNDAINQIDQRFKGLNADTTTALAETAASGYNNLQAANLQNSQSNAQTEKLTSTLNNMMSKIETAINKAIAAQGQANNVFNIQSNDPTAVAKEVDRILQRQVERRQASWGK